MDIKKRTTNITIIHPPFLKGEFPVLFSSWTPTYEVDESDENICPLYIMKISADPFGCNLKSGSIIYISCIYYIINLIIYIMDI
jgi:hypothetical protein